MFLGRLILPSIVIVWAIKFWTEADGIPSKTKKFILACLVFYFLNIFLELHYFGRITEITILIFNTALALFTVFYPLKRKIKSND